MNEHELSGQEHVRNPEVSFEPRDLSVRGVVGFLAALGIAGIIVLVVLWSAYKYLAGSQIQPPLVNQRIVVGKQQEDTHDLIHKFPAPRLQPDPVGDLNTFRADEEERLNSYGWVDRGAGKVHIPIERAIDTLAASGLPVRQNAAASTAASAGAVGAAGGINMTPGAGEAVAAP